MRSPVLAAIFGILLGPAASAAERPVVVELFTSQGCSSCPPADRFLTELAQGHRDLLVLAFHITYWNYLGWRDPYSFTAATDRQTRYANRLSEGKLFTPQMVVNGTRSLWGSNRGEAATAIQSARSEDTPAAAVTLTRDGGRVRITVGPGAGEARVVLVGYDREHRTAIGRGENTGRSLTESNIVRSFSTVGNWSGSAVTLAADAPAGEAFAVILQAPDGRIVGAAKLAS